MKTDARTTILEKIEEKSEKSSSSLETKNYDLKRQQSKTDIFRLNGGWGWGYGWNLIAEKNRSQKNNNQRKSRNMSDNEKTKNETHSVRLAEKESLPSAVDNIEYRNNRMKDPEKSKLVDRSSRRSKTKPNEVITLPVNKADIPTSLIFKQTPAWDYKFEVKDSNMSRSKDKKQTASTIDDQLRCNEQTAAIAEKTSTHQAPNTYITTSFIENLVGETVPFSLSSSKSELKNFIPACAKSCSHHTQHEMIDTGLRDVKPVTDLLFSLLSNEEISKRIENLEEEVDQINLQFKCLQKELLPADDLAKLNVLSKHFYEVDKLLIDLKVNCLKLKNMKIPMCQRTQPTINEKNVKSISQENFISTIDFSIDNSESRSTCSHICLKTCNREVHKRSTSLFSENYSFENQPLQNCSCKSTNENFNDFRLTCNCVKFLPNIQTQNSVEQSGQQIKQDMPIKMDNEIYFRKPYKNLLEMNYRFNQDTNDNLLPKLPLRAEEIKMPFANWDISPKKFPFATQTNRSTSQYNKKCKLSHYKLYQRPCKKTVRSSNEETNRKFNWKEFPILPEENKKRKLAAICTSIPSSVANETKTENFIETDSLVQDTVSFTNGELPLTTHNLITAILEVIGNRSLDNIALIIYLESNNLYHINVSATKTGQCLGCIFSNEAAFKQAKKEKVFDDFLIFFVLCSDNTLEERNKVLGHSFEFINIID